jgi:hypothetical protein
VANHLGGTATYTLGPIELAGQTQYAVRIPTSNPNRTYWVEFRQPIGFDSGLSSFPNLGAQIRVSYPFENQCSGCTGLYDDTQFLDMTPGTGAFTDGALASGQTYTDSAYNVTIQVLSASSSALSVQVTTGGAAATTTTLASSANPSAAGQSVSFTASVTGSNPTGNVAFKDAGSPLSGCSAVALTGSGNTRTAVCATSALAVGVHSITADYAGDASNGSSSSSALSQTVKASTTTTIASSLNPSISGNSVTFTATVNGSAPSGTVAFTSDGASIAGCASAALTGSGNSRTATCATAALTVGTHAVVANYGGDGSNATSSSTSLSQVVNSAGLPATTTTLASSQNPSTFGALVTITATVAGNAPTGTVAFTSDGATIAGCGAASLTGSGNTRTAACDAFTLAVGTHTIVGVYSGNAGNAGSVSAPLSQVVNAASTNATATVVTSASNPATEGSPVALTATIAPPASGGTVAFTANGAPIAGCASVPVSGGTALCNAPLATGAHSVVASYSGNGTAQASASPIFSQVIPFAAIGNSIQLASSAYAVNETAGNVVLTVTRMGDVSAPASVNFTTAAGSATSGIDFTAASGTLSWGAHDASTRTIVVAIVDDGIAEANETFTVTLSGAQGAVVGANSVATVTIFDDESAAASTPGLATVAQNPYGALSIQGGTLNGNTISGLQKNAVIQLGAIAGVAGSFAKIDFQGLDLGAGNTLTIRSGAAGQTIFLTNVNGSVANITGTLLAQGGGGAPAPALVVQSVGGLTVNAGGSITALAGLALDTLGATITTGGNVVNQGRVDGGASLAISAAKVNGGGAFLGNALTLQTFGNLNNPVNGSHFLANGLQLYPSSGAGMSVALAGYGSAPQFINLMIHGNATLSMPSAWPNGSGLPPNNRPLMPSEIRAAGVADPAYGGGGVIVQATGNLALNGGVSQDFVFPGGLAFIAAGTLDVQGTAIDNGWTTSGQPFQGVFFEAPSIVDSTAATAIAVRTNNLNWVNASSRPMLPVKTWTLQQQPGGSAQFATSDATVPHLNIYSIEVEAGAANQCWTCLVNSQVIDFSVAP